MPENPIKQSMDDAVRHYSSLFRLPSLQKVLSLLALICVSGGLVSSVVLSPSSEGLIRGFFLGTSLFAISLLTDWAVTSLVLNEEALFDLRRTVSLSLFCWTPWFLFVLIGTVLGVALGLVWWIRLSLLGASSVMIFRLVVFNSTTSLRQWRILVASLFQPLICAIPFLLLWFMEDHSLSTAIPIYFAISIASAFVGATIYLHMIDHLGKNALGMPSMSLFKAFVRNWVLSQSAPFEDLLEKLSEKRDVDVSLVKFNSSSDFKTLVVVPSIHPGPFKNIGSSLLPSLLKTELEAKLGCIACVPHGLFGHEFDLASQHQNQRIISSVTVSLEELKDPDVTVSPFLKVQKGSATASCQIFGKSVLISFTLAPRTIEDLPEDLGSCVREKAERLGLKPCAIINAHNCIEETADMNESLEDLKEAATECLIKAAAAKQSPFEIGASTILPQDFTLEEGMGSGGITAIIIKNLDQKCAYVVIDGNNMVSGLREKILTSLESIGIDDGEVFTTDAHSVSAVVLRGRGYHPIGEVINHEKLIAYIKEAASAAASRLQASEVECGVVTVPNVLVLGEKRLETLCLLIEKATQKAKQLLIPIFGTIEIVLMMFLLLV